MTPGERSAGHGYAEASANIQRRADELHGAATAAFEANGAIGRAVQTLRGRGQAAIDGEYQMRSEQAHGIAERHMDEIHDAALEEQRQIIEETQ